MIVTGASHIQNIYGILYHNMKRIANKCLYKVVEVDMIKETEQK